MAWALCAPAQAANVIQTYFAPFPENDLQVIFNAVDGYRTNVGTVIHTVISMVPGMTNTIIYYDHWEDGFEPDITSPTQSTTQVWGDYNTTNGIPPGFVVDAVGAGDVINLETNIDVTRSSVQIEYDGGDKISCTRPISLSRAMYPVDPGEVIADCANSLDTSLWGLSYRAPVGTGTGTGVGTNETFEYTALLVMAAYDYTRVEIDKNGDGAVDITLRLDQGEHFLVNGGVLAGATVTATKPVQVHLATGDIGSNYETRFYELWPENAWSDSYFTPISARRYYADGTIFGTMVYFYNDQTNDITVYYTNRYGGGSVVVPAGGNNSTNPVSVPTNSGARFYTADGSVFQAVQVFDDRVMSTNPPQPQHLQTYDWGAMLPPFKTLTTVSILGYGPGEGSTAVGSNAQPVFVTTEADGTVYVDYDSDPTTGPLTDPLGNRCNVITNLLALHSTVFYDDSDTNQTAMRVYTLDGNLITTAWGEDPVRAAYGNPYLDMGQMILPFPTILAQKHAILFTDLNGNGVPDPGDSLQFIISVVNSGFATANDVVLEDEGATNTTMYVPGSSFAGTNVVTDDAVPPSGTVFPFDEGGHNIGTIPVGGTAVVTYVSTIYNPFPSNQLPSIYNGAYVVESNGQWSTLGFTNVNLSGMTLTKTVDPAGLVVPGTTLTYTITIANTGTITLTGLELQDILPLGVAFVPTGTVVRYPLGITNTVLDRFDWQAYTNHHGTVRWLNNWQEAGESDGAIAGDVSVLADKSVVPMESFALRVGYSNNAAWRMADLSGYNNAFLSFSFKPDSLDAATDYVDVQVSSNGGTTWATLDRFQGVASGTVYRATNYEISAYMSTNTTVRFLSSSSPNMGAADAVWFDNVQIASAGSNVVLRPDVDLPVVFSEYCLPPGTSIVVTLLATVDKPPTATQLVNTARTRSDQHEAWLYAYATNQVDAKPGVGLTKTVDPAGLVVTGMTLTYTITISNTGDLQQTNIRLEDDLPLGVTYMPGSAWVYRPFGYSNDVRDLFNAKAYTNNDGDFSWAADGLEIGEADGAEAGDVQVMNDGAVVPGHVYALRIGNADHGFSRMANLEGFSGATLSFEYRREALDGITDYVAAYASSNGGSSWTELGRFTGAGTDAQYYSTNYSLTAYLASNTVVRFLASGTLGAADYVWFDDVRIVASGSGGTNRVSDPVSMFTDYYLPPYTSMVITLQATVDDPASATQMINEARMMSDQQTTWLYGWATNWLDGIIGMAISKTSSMYGTRWRPDETNTYTIEIWNTGTIRQTQMQLYDPLASAYITYVPGSTEILWWGGQATNVSTNVTADVVTNIVTNVVVTSVVTNAVSGTVRDEFNAIAFTNQNGTVNWLNNWQEEGDGGAGAGAGAGDVVVANYWASNYQLMVKDDLNGAWRSANLGGIAGLGIVYTGAVFSFDFRRSGLDAGEYVNAYVRTSPAAVWVTIWGCTNGTDAATRSTNFSFPAYLSTGAAVRFYAPVGTMGDADGATFDNVQIAYYGLQRLTNWGTNYTPNVVTNYSTNILTNVVSSVITNAGTLPPTVMTNFSLNPGTNMWVRYKVTLNDPYVIEDITNVATLTSALQTDPLYASITDTVAYMDLGVTKTVNNPTPIEGAVITYTIVVTNYGPDEERSTVFGDLLPAGVTYSNHTAGTGTFSAVSGVWTIGTVAVGGSATLTIQAQVDTNTANTTITNWVNLTGRKLIDLVSTNNQSSAKITPRPTLVLVSATKAYERDGAVVFEWETAMEVGTVGFRVRRGNVGSGEREPVGGFIPGLLTAPQGGTYRVADPGAAPGGTYEYEIEEVLANGGRIPYGPFTIFVEPEGAAAKAAKARVLSRAVGKDAGDGVPGFEREERPVSGRKHERIAARAVERAATQESLGAEYGNQVKIFVERDGLNYLGRDTLAGLLNLPALYVGQLIAGGYLELRNQGQKAAYLSDSGRGLYFWGQGPTNLYTGRNVYWLGYGRNAAVRSLSLTTPKPASSSLTFADRVSAEEDRLAIPAFFHDPEADIWMWAYLFGGFAGFDRTAVTVRASGVASSGSATLVTRLFGGSASGAAADHHVEVRVNGTLVGSGVWAGEAPYSLRATFSQGLLREGDNTVEVRALLDGGVPYSVVYLDGLDLDYRRLYRAVGDQLKFRRDGNKVVTVSGFTSKTIYVYDVSNPLAPAYVKKGLRIDGTAGNYRVSLAPPSKTATYLAFAAGSAEGPEAVAAFPLSGLASPLTMADYVIITVDELEEAAQGLADYRQAQGHRTLVVNLEAIYDTFNYGNESPWAIRRFLEFAHRFWLRGPSYVVLAGEGTYDYQDHLGYGENLVPTKTIDTPFGLAESDTWLADVDGNDGVPEMAIGRLPAMTSAELEGMIAKIVAYEAASGAWASRVILAADKPDDAGDFPADSDDIALLVPAGYGVSKIYLNGSNLAASRTALRDGINAGALFLNYIGHGAYDRFVAGGLLKTNDVPLLVNGEKLPVVAAMTCAAGRYSMPGHDCLGEHLVLSEGGGAIGFWGPTGLSMNDLAKRLDAAFFRARFEESETVLGDAILRALDEYSTSGGDLYMLRIYSLLGDPALRVK